MLVRGNEESNSGGIMSLNVVTAHNNVMKCTLTAVYFIPADFNVIIK